MSSLVVMHLMDWDGGMNSLSLNSLLVDDRLHKLVHMVVYMFANNSLVLRRRMGGGESSRDVTEESSKLC